MHLTHSLSVLIASTTTTTTSSSNSGSSSLFLVVIVALVAAFYFLMIRPNQRRRMQAMRESRAYDIGDEVVAGGMVGHVVRIGDGEVDVEVANGVIITFVPQAVQSRAAYNARPAGRGMGGGMGSGMGAGGYPPRSTSTVNRRRANPGSDAWPSSDDPTGLDEGDNGSAGAADGGAADDVNTSGGDGDVEPTGEER
jgi:preprotein translocase subunit YajC